MRRLVLCFLQTLIGIGVWLPAILYVTSAGVVRADDFSYAVNPDNTVTITGYNGTNGVANIPSTTNGLLVTSIGFEAFYNCSNLTSVAIGNNVTNIGDYAFWGCNSLTNVVIPASVTSIGNEVFVYCYDLNNITIPTGVTRIRLQLFFDCFSLNNVTIPTNVTTIEYQAFYGCCNLTNFMISADVTNIGYGLFEYCSNLTAIGVDPSNSAYISVDGVLFDKSQTTLIQYPAGCQGGCYTIPNSVTSILHGAFAGSTVTNVTIPTSVTSIVKSVFKNCNSLTSIVIPVDITNVGTTAFEYDYNLTGVYFKGNAPAVDSTAFTGDTNAIVYYLPGTTGWTTNFGGIHTSLWFPRISRGGSLDIQPNQFGFNVNWASGMVCVVEACTDLTSSSWRPIQTNVLSADSCYFSDPDLTNDPRRFYRIVWP